MEEKHRPESLWMASGCLTEEALRDFSAGRLSADEEQRVRQHVGRCEFCRMAAEGMKGFLEDSDEKAYGNLLGELQEQVDERVRTAGAGEPISGTTKKRTNLIWTLVSVAATVLMLAGLYMVIRLWLPEHRPQVAQVTSSQPAPDTARALPEESPHASAGPVGRPALEVTRDAGGTGQMASAEQTVMAEDQSTPPPYSGHAGEIADPAAVSKTLSSRVPPAVNPETTNPARLPETDSAGEVTIATELKEVTASEQVQVTALEVISSSRSRKKTVASKAPESTPVYTPAEELPVFPGGEEALKKFLADNIKYPESARESKISGTVQVSFLVDPKGRILEPEVKQGIGGGCDEEALRVVRAMPRWIPGKQAGKTVSTRMTLPVKFSLSTEH